MTESIIQTTHRTSCDSGCKIPRVSLGDIIKRGASFDDDTMTIHAFCKRVRNIISYAMCNFMWHTCGNDEASNRLQH